jgi:hypothetical protein
MDEETVQNALQKQEMRAVDWSLALFNKMLFSDSSINYHNLV